MSETPSKPKLLILGKLSHIQKEWNDFAQKYEVVEFISKSRDEFITDCKGKYDGLVGIYSFVTGQHVIGGMDEEIAKALPSTLKFVCHSGAGYNLIDVQHLSRRGIQVSNTPLVVNGATADTAIYLMLGALRNFNRLATELRRNNWNRNVPEAHDPAGKVLGILGMGGVGQAFRDKATVFGFSKILYHNRHRLSEEEEKGAEYVSFDDLLAQSDVLSLNLPLNANTRGIICAETLCKCKEGVTIVNVGRGALINEADLVKALESGKVYSVGLDSYEEEPVINAGLLSNENVLLLPHIGTHSVETRREMELVTLRNLKSGLETGKLINLVSEQVGLF
ncbi:Gor1p [Sugiyamaella lignohabitans]|uniref:Gor1p n=1 Tax=Sugiyamaella lignohabitans TaxID=796027 RepID=A0A167FZI9_9ASCO|nr:Gor1p [Sugiyamaella lignohabitans]ANB15905.1 Gor1p [Sugiyamaella lignohabitans]